MIERIASALDVESYSLFQNTPKGDGRALTPLQRQEISNKVFDSVTKIIAQY
jgi:hypothetical protein